MSQFDLAGKVVIITGSSRGIGKAAAEELAANGAKVVISSRNQDVCDVVAAEINAKHGEGTAIAVAASIAHKAQLENLVNETRKAFGRVDVVVCNAATNPHYGSLGTITDDQFRKIFDNNVLSNHWLVQLVIGEMIERKEGSIVIISSVGGLRGSDVIGGYNVSKAADFQLARNLAVEYGRYGIRANCIAPGLVRTDFAKALWEDPQIEKTITAETPLRRIGEPHEIAGAVTFLASSASAFMTGQAMIVDGGATIRS